MTTDEAAAEALATTREYLETHGWTQGDLSDGNGRVCLFGAMVYSHDLWDVDNECLEETVNSQGELLAAAWYLADLVEPDWRAHYREHYGSAWRSFAPVEELIRWNDGSVADAQEVLDALAKAEKVARTGFDPDA